MLTTMSETAPKIASREPTMRDVGAVAGVSLKTVSRVVNREAGVSAELVTRVNAAVELLGYRHNLTASSLRRGDGRTATIGLVLEDVANPFSSALYRAIERIALRRGTQVLAGSSDEDPTRVAELLFTFDQRRVDGLIVAQAGRGDGGLGRDLRRGQPIVFVDRPGPNINDDHVITNNRGAVAEIVQHLVNGGHQRIAYIGDMPLIWTAAERHTGFLEGLATARVTLFDRYVRMDVRGADAAAAAATDLLAMQTPPTAIVTGQNLLTIGVVRALQALELQETVALVGFDDIPMADCLTPRLSAMVQDVEELGRTAATILFDRIAGDDGPPKRLVLPSRLVARGSGEISPPR